MQRGVDWLETLRCRTRRIAYEWVKTVGEGARKSVCFWGLLRWSVGRHGLLRSRCIHARQRWGRRQSALTLIAFQALSIRCWFRFASPGRQGKGLWRSRSAPLKKPWDLFRGGIRTHLTFDLFLQLRIKWQQRAETPTLINRIHTSSSHHTVHQCSNSAEEWIRPITSSHIAVPITPSSRAYRTGRFPAQRTR